MSFYSWGLVPRCIFSMQARTIYVWQLPNQKIYKDGKLMWKILFMAVVWLSGTFVAAGISPMALLLFHSIFLMSLWWVTLCFSTIFLLTSKSVLPHPSPTPGEVHFPGKLGLAGWVTLANWVREAVAPAYPKWMLENALRELPPALW